TPSIRPFPYTTLFRSVRESRTCPSRELQHRWSVLPWLTSLGCSGRLVAGDGDLEKRLRLRSSRQRRHGTGGDSVVCGTTGIVRRLDREGVYNSPARRARRAVVLPDQGVGVCPLVESQHHSHAEPGMDEGRGSVERRHAEVL